MSTKTTFKRIALVAVAALGLSIVSVAPSGAAIQADSLNHFRVATCSNLGTIGATNVATTASNYDDCGNYDSETTNVLINNTAVYGFAQSFLSSVIGDAATVTARLVRNAYNGTDATVDGIAPYSVPTALPILTAGNYGNHLNSAANLTQGVSAANLVLTNTSTATGSITGAAKATFTPTLRGTYVITFTPQAGSLATAKTWTVNAYATQGALDAANGVDQVVSVAKTTSLLVAGDTVAVGVSDAVVLASKKTQAVARATVVVTANNAAGTSIAANTTLSATISGPGLLSIGTAAGQTAVGRAVTGAIGQKVVQIYSDGTSGKATVTISAGTTVLSTETVTFYGDSTAFSVDADSDDTQYTSAAISVATQGVASYLGVGEQQWWSVSLVDAAGVTSELAPAVTITIADKTILSDPGQAAGIVKVQGVKAGTTTFTVKDTATGKIVLGPVTVNVSGTKAASATFTLDKSDYVSGEAFVLTINAKDANGLPFANGAYALMASVSSNVLTYSSLGGILTGAQSPVFAGGVATIKGFMPQGTGAVTFTLTLGTNGVATAAQGAKLTATANVGSAAVDAATAAIDAAAEATDAANAATDAANAAAEAADAATAAAQDAADAVAALSAQVTEMIAALQAQNNALRKQLIALTNLIIKIQKKIKA